MNCNKHCYLYRKYIGSLPVLISFWLAAFCNLLSSKHIRINSSLKCSTKYRTSLKITIIKSQMVVFVIIFFFQVARNCIRCWHTCYIVTHSGSAFELFLSLVPVSAADFNFPCSVSLLVDRLVHRGERNKAQKVQARVGWPGREI